MLPCAYQALFGIDCPLCGSQRSMIQLLKGDLAESFSIYPPLVPVILLIGLSVLKLMYRPVIKTEFLKIYSLVVLVIVMLNYFIKLTL
jgi:hypothetical protein